MTVISDEEKDKRKKEFELIVSEYEKHDFLDLEQ